MNKLMTALTVQHDAGAAMLTSNCKKQERSITIDLSVSPSQGGLQMFIEFRIEKVKTKDI